MSPQNPAHPAPPEKRTQLPTLLNKRQAAREVFGVSQRTFEKLRSEPWMPAPVVLAPRVLRWSRAELEAAVVNIPRQTAPAAEPQQLRRGKSLAIQGRQ